MCEEVKVPQVWWQAPLPTDPLLAPSRYLLKDVKNEINELEKNITSITPTINEINRLLQGFGFTNFMIREVPHEKNQYQIVRENGEIATSTLSEGERTFITFYSWLITFICTKFIFTNR